MLKHRQLFTLFFFLSAPAFSQSDFREGFLITNERDTIRGLIDLQSNTRNTQVCRFKRDEDASVRTFLPGDIAGYRIDGSKYYSSREVEIGGEPRQVFLEFLLYGIANLYYVALDQEEFYYIEKDGILHQLSAGNETIKRAGKLYEKRTGNFKGLLKYLYSDARDLDRQIAHASFDHKSMIALARDYHNQVCDEFDCVVFERSTQAPVYLEPRIGFLTANMRLKGSEDVSVDHNFIVGTHLSFTSLKIQDIWRFSLGLHYAGLHFEEAKYNTEQNRNQPDDWLVDVKYQFLEVPVMVKYTLFPARLQPYILGGMEMVIMMNSESEVSSTAGVRLDGEDFRRFNVGVIGGAGVRAPIKEHVNFIIEANYTYRNPAATLGGVLDNLHINSLAFFVGLDMCMNRDY